MRPDSITLAIFEKYKPEELAETAQKLVQALADKETAETEKKVSDAVFKERINKHEAEAAALAKQYGKGGETAQIGCTIRYDTPAPGKKSYIRMDREEVVEVHDMSPEEKQETFQFPLTASATDEPKPKRERKHKHEDELPAPSEAPKSTSEIQFRDIQSIAATICKIAPENRAESQAEMQTKIANCMFAQKGVIGPDGRVETIDSIATADKLAAAWLELAIQENLKPPSAEEVTRICPYPACILFSEHEGEHEFPKVEATDETKVDASPEPQPEKERKTKRRKRDFAPPPEPPCQEPPADSQGLD